MKALNNDHSAWDKLLTGSSILPKLLLKSTLFALNVKNNVRIYSSLFQHTIVQWYKLELVHVAWRFQRTVDWVVSPVWAWTLNFLVKTMQTSVHNRAHLVPWIVCYLDSWFGILRVTLLWKARKSTTNPLWYKPVACHCEWWKVRRSWSCKSKQVKHLALNCDVSASDLETGTHFYQMISCKQLLSPPTRLSMTSILVVIVIHMWWQNGNI